LDYTDIKHPEPKADEVLVKIHVAQVNPLTGKSATVWAKCSE
jgi:NADPH:quinone reductase-like Zn-dependent oxidoreductase